MEKEKTKECPIVALLRGDQKASRRRADKEEVRLKMTAKKTGKDFVEKSGEGGVDKFIERIA